MKLMKMQSDNNHECKSFSENIIRKKFSCGRILENFKSESKQMKKLK